MPTNVSAAENTNPGPRNYVDATLAGWLREHADTLNREADHAEQVIPRLASAGLFGVGVPIEDGGVGGDVCHAALAIAEVAEYSLTAAFVYWGQRSFIEYLLQSPNSELSGRFLPVLLKGEQAGASGLSNAMKFLGGIESLKVFAEKRDDGWNLNGTLPWVTNLRKGGFIVAAAVATTAGQPAMVVAIDSQVRGVERTADLDLIALRGSNTAAIRLTDIALDRVHVLHDNAGSYLPAVRPAFLAMQCGLSIGLARASLRDALAQSEQRRGILSSSIRDLQLDLDDTVARLLKGVADHSFKTRAAPLFRLRIRLAEIAQQSVGLELQAKGGAAYLDPMQNNFSRRWSEAAFVPIVTPSLTQLQAELERHAQSQQ